MCVVESEGSDGGFRYLDLKGLVFKNTLFY